MNRHGVGRFVNAACVRVSWPACCSKPTSGAFRRLAAICSADSGTGWRRSALRLNSSASNTASAATTSRLVDTQTRRRRVPHRVAAHFERNIENRFKRLRRVTTAAAGAQDSRLNNVCSANTERAIAAARPKFDALRYAAL